MPNWYVMHKGKEVGPMSSEQLKKLASSGKIDPQTQVRTDESPAWSNASKVKGLFTAIASPKAEVIVPQPKITPTEIVAQYTEPEKNTKPCPFCGEEIQKSAAKCRFCNEFLDPALRSASNYPAPAAASAPQPIVNVVQSNTTTIRAPRWSPGVAMILSFILPGLGQIYKGQLFNGLLWLVVVIVGYCFVIVPGVVLHILCVMGAGRGDPYK